MVLLLGDKSVRLESIFTNRAQVKIVMLFQEAAMWLDLKTDTGQILVFPACYIFSENYWKS